jgi:hypothetical protein
MADDSGPDDEHVEPLDRQLGASLGGLRHSR